MSQSQKVAGVVLAAGASTRFAKLKQIFEYGGQPLVRRAALAALDAGCDPVIVVTGSDSELVAEAVSGLNVKTVSNHDWDTGLASSLRSGIGAACAMSDCDAVLITLADQPRVTASSLRKLLGAFDAKHRIVAAEYSGTIGVPALFGREHLDRLMQTRGDIGAGPFLRSHRKEVTAIPLEEAALDVDTPEDLAKLGDGAA